MKIMFVLAMIGSSCDQCAPVLVRTRWVLAISAIAITQCKIVMQCFPIGILARMIVNLPKCVSVSNIMAKTKGNMAAWERREKKEMKVKPKVAGGRGETIGVRVHARNI